jgi:hypothetical protein
MEGKEVRQAFKQEKDYACTKRRNYSLASFFSVLLYINWIGGMEGMGIHKCKGTISYGLKPCFFRIIIVYSALTVWKNLCAVIL